MPCRGYTFPFTSAKGIPLVYELTTTCTYIIQGFLNLRGFFISL